MPILKVCTKYTYPESGTRNGRVYTQEVLEKAFNEYIFKEACDRRFISVRDETTGESDFLGYATARLENDTTVIIEAEIDNSNYIEMLKELEDNSIGLILAGVGHTEYRDGKQLVTDVSFDRVELTRHPAVDYTTKIDRDNIFEPEHYRLCPWLVDDFGYRRTLEQLIEN